MARVTVVNDSSEFPVVMRDLLSMLGHEMVGLEAVNASIEQIVDSQPDVLIVDLRLESTPQVMSGWELLVLARSHGHLGSVPVILCSGDLWEPEKRAKDLEQIANVHVRTKPLRSTTCATSSLGC